MGRNLRSRKRSNTNQNEAVPTKRSKNNGSQAISQSNEQIFLAICLCCGKHLQGRQITSNFENHICRKENLNSFTECIGILKSAAVKIIDSYGGHIAPQASAPLPTTPSPPPSSSTMPPPPPPPPSETLNFPEPQIPYIDELKRVLK